jgi:light-regulated signal transduction histidine kinase (bacteriophytochrome)
MHTIVERVVQELSADQPHCKAKFKINPLPAAVCDARMIKQVWANLIANAVKYSSKREAPEIEIGTSNTDEETIYYIKDNGAGFEMKYARKLFTVFHRLHNDAEFEGTGVGLATVANIVGRHGGRVWADAKPNEGATFYFTLSA